ncbi:discoidin domain-containing protein [Coraliomargarita sp. SDUM461004]|uniref:Discoidin domain-containing protein n=1 Tax=Thalassobacterium sedimentorum TaxID=3041258 RepID=A0ABU1ALP3_9BACT|nr:discoidin domain-containing protein [Coraliomargarita sp. SDUM461004]MDQ8194770.1 discoidin domain-containing protein [Coraliomargarita sp. SDUM461004]
MAFAVFFLINHLYGVSLLSSNALSGEFPQDAVATISGATYRWINTGDGNGRGNTDAALLIQDGGSTATNQRLRDGRSLEIGGSAGLYQTWDGAKGGTAQFDLGRQCSLEFVQVSARFRFDINAIGVSLIEVWTSVDGTQFERFEVWTGPAPLADTNEGILTVRSGAPVVARYVQIFIHRDESAINGSFSPGNTWYHQLAIGEIALYGTPLQIVTSNVSTGDFPGASETMIAGASYRWINESGHGYGATDTNIITQDGGVSAPNQRMRDGRSLLSGGSYGVYPVWQGAQGATLEFDLGQVYLINLVRISAYFDAYRGISYAEVYTSLDGINFNLWNSWSGPAPVVDSKNYVLSLNPGWQAPARYVRVFTHRSETAIKGSLTAGNANYSQAPLGEITIHGTAAPPATVLTFGASSHMIHTPFFIPNLNDSWNVDNTVPYLAYGNFGGVREPLYQNLFDGIDEGFASNNQTFAMNRAEVARCLAAYQQAGISVILTPMFSATDDDGRRTRFGAWIASLVDSYSCIQAVELGNEPNLSTFWSGTVEDYVMIAAEFAGLVRASSRQVPVLVGAFSGWGGAWSFPSMIAEANYDNRVISTAWLLKAIDAGLLSFADGVSFHPYRSSSAPEGGNEIEARLDPEGFAKEIVYLDRIITESVGHQLPIYFTEIGYSTEAGGNGSTYVDSESRKADYLSRTMLLVLDSKLRGIPLMGVYWYDLKKDEYSDDYETNFGLLDIDFGAKSARLFNLLRDPDYRIISHTAYSWLVNSSLGNALGHTDPQVISQDAGLAKMTDGYGLFHGAATGVWGTWFNDPSAGVGATAQIDLQEVTVVDRVAISAEFTSSVGVAQCTVYASSDGSNYTLFGAWDNSIPLVVNRNGIITIKGDTPVAARFLRIFMSPCSPTRSYHQMQIGEIAVIAPVAPVPASSVTPAFESYRQIMETFGSPHIITAYPLPSRLTTGGGLLKYFLWRRQSDGQILVPFWRLNQLQSSEDQDTDISTTLSIDLPPGATVTSVVLHDLNNQSVAATAYSINHDTVSIPIIASARVAWLEITLTGGLFASINSAVTDHFATLDADADGLPDAWEISYGFDPDSVATEYGRMGDIDGDGIPNLLEYAFGLDPLTPDFSTVKMEHVHDEVTGKDYFELTFHRLIDLGAITYQIFISYDLANWTTSKIKPELISATPDANGTTETVVLRIHSPLDLGKLFIRIKVDTN